MGWREEMGVSYIYIYKDQCDEVDLVSDVKSMLNAKKNMMIIYINIYIYIYIYAYYNYINNIKCVSKCI